MVDLELFQQNLVAKGYSVTHFHTAAEATDYLDAALDGKTVGIGGSISIQEMGLVRRLDTHCAPISHWAGATQQEAAAAQIYLSSVNGAAETGELVNIDGTGNRVASGLFGHEKVYFVIGANKIEPSLEGAIHRARNVAAPKNAQRLSRKTPCAVKGDKCYDCDSPERICSALVVYWKKPSGMPFEVVLVDETLGY